MQNWQLLTVVALAWRLVRIGDDAVLGVSRCTASLDINNRTSLNQSILESVAQKLQQEECTDLMNDLIKALGMSVGLISKGDYTVINYVTAAVLILRQKKGNVQFGDVADLISAAIYVMMVITKDKRERERDTQGRFKRSVISK